MMEVDLQTYLPDDILTKVDRASMAVSLETRVPFLEHRVVEHAWRMPLELKRRPGQTNWAVRQLLYRHVPRDLVDRPKKGFSVPIHEWLRGPLREWAEDLLSERRLKSEGYFRRGTIRDAWQAHSRGDANMQSQLWTVLMFQSRLRDQSSRA
jgi:asparagine synthase (glutamine-hydrolysing)